MTPNSKPGSYHATNALSICVESATASNGADFDAAQSKPKSYSTTNAIAFSVESAAAPDEADFGDAKLQAQILLYH